MIDVNELATFVAEAVTIGWPDNTVPSNDPDFPGFYGGSYVRGCWRYLDIWSGVSTDAGMMVVFYEQTAVWMCTYRGGILPGTIHLGQTAIAENELFGFLIEALHAGHQSSPRLRGPNRFTSADGRWNYAFEMTGDITGFWAIEQISEHGQLEYERILVGGRVGDGVQYGTGSLLDAIQAIRMTL